MVVPTARRSTFAQLHEIWTVFLRGQTWSTTQHSPTPHLTSKRAFSAAAQGKNETGKTTSTSASSPAKAETKVPLQRRKYVHPPFHIHKTENIGSFFPAPLATKENQRMQRQGRYKHDPTDWVQHIGHAHGRIAGRKHKSRVKECASYPLPAVTANVDSSLSPHAFVADKVPAKRSSPTPTIPPGHNIPSSPPDRLLPTHPRSLFLTRYLEKRNDHPATKGLSGTSTSPNEKAVDQQITLKESCSHPNGESYIYPRLRNMPPPAPAPTLTGGSSLNLVRHFGPTKRKPQTHVSDQAYLLLAADDDNE